MKCPLCEAFLTDATLLGGVGIFIRFRCNHCGEDFALGFPDADLLTVADIPDDDHPLPTSDPSRVYGAP